MTMNTNKENRDIGQVINHFDNYASTLNRLVQELGQEQRENRKEQSDQRERITRLEGMMERLGKLSEQNSKENREILNELHKQNADKRLLEADRHDFKEDVQAIYAKQIEAQKECEKNFDSNMESLAATNKKVDSLGKKADSLDKKVTKIYTVVATIGAIAVALQVIVKFWNDASKAVGG